MKTHSKIIISTLLISSTALLGQAYADSHAKMEKKPYASSMEYDKFRNDKSPYQVRASELIGEEVDNAEEDGIGEIDDLVFSSKDNKLYAIISVGGFLGMGDRLVAVPYSELRVTDDGDDVYLDATEESLKGMPEFKYNKGEVLGSKTMMERSEIRREEQKDK
ncbi:MAG: PRC-barrel domain-containing protein [Amphritea sp.]|nr:PRC-barrel domain-containing protein [Amphritea sp.]